jgi:hypothetical protein
MARSEVHVPVLPLQLASNSRLFVFFGHYGRIFLCNMNQQIAHFSNWYFNSVFEIFCMFRPSRYETWKTSKIEKIELKY